MTEFEKQKAQRIRKMGEDASLKEVSLNWFRTTFPCQYSHHFTWLGRPIIQYPQDIVALQEILWKVKPDLVLETGIAHGGSLIFSASILELLGGNGQVLGIDIDIRAHNRVEIERHPMSKRITMMQGSSVDGSVAQEVYAFAKGKERVVVILDSNHTHEHVLKEMELYSPLVNRDSYLVVLDTIIGHLPDEFFPDRPWNSTNNPETAVQEFLKTNDRFEVDREIENKLLITVAPGGYLKCIKSLPGRPDSLAEAKP